MTDLNTEGPTTGQGVAAGGVDKAKEAALAEQGDEATPTSTAVPADTQVQAPSADDVTTSGEPADAEDDSADEADAATAPTPEEQAELDQMVDYTVREGDEFPDLPDGTPVRAGDVVKLGKDHPLLEGDDADTSSEDGQ